MPAMSNVLLPIDPLDIIDTLEAESSAVDAPYRTRVEALMPEILRSTSDDDHAADALLLRQTGAGMALETAARMTGFVMGFEHCLRVLGKGGA